MTNDNYLVNGCLIDITFININAWMDYGLI